MGRPSKHSPEVRERAVRMVFDQPRASVAGGRDSVGGRETRDPVLFHAAADDHTARW
jgi:hypothetical protein